MKPTRAIIACMFIVSGALGLVYEVLWQRQFSLLFGSAAPATAAVLTAYFAGLGIGNYLFGRQRRPLARPLVLYGALEIAIGIGVLVVPRLLEIYPRMLPGAAQAFGGSSLLLLKGLLAFAAIAVPAIAMGGTLPVLADLSGEEEQSIGQRVGWLYLLNTAGAALGTLAVPHLLLPMLGMVGTTNAAAFINVIIGALAIFLGRRLPVNISPRLATRVPPKILALAFISGTGIFALQVFWNRAFGQIHENSLYSFSLLVALFILAIALGAELARFLLRRKHDALGSLAKLWMIGGLLTSLAPFLFIAVSGGLKYAEDALSPARSGVLLVLLPIIPLAAAIPLFFQAGGAAGAPASATAGTILSANIAGCIIGALLAGFAAPAILTLWQGIALTGALFAFCGSALLKGKTRWVSVAGVMLLLATVFFANPPRVRVDTQQGETLLAIVESPHGIVAATERIGSRRLKLNNHYVLGGTASTGDERMQAHIPLILGAPSSNVVFLGYGTGITASGSLLHPLESATAVELVPEVARLASQFFATENLNFGRAARSNLIIDDARMTMRSARARYDVVIGDLVVPWRPGESGLYTLEHFAAIKSALTPGGLACVWLPLFQLSEREFKILLGTFISTFGHAVIWRGDFSPTAPSLALIAADQPGLLDPARVAAGLRSMQADPANPHLRHPAAFWMHFVGMVTPDQLFGGRAERLINSENYPVVELRLFKGAAFVGNAADEWQKQVRAGSAHLAEKLDQEARNGWAAGFLMNDYTRLLYQNNPAAAASAQKAIVDLIGSEASSAVFGGQ